MGVKAEATANGYRSEGEGFVEHMMNEIRRGREQG